VRVCEWTAGTATLIAAGSAQDSLDGCYYHADPGYSGARLWHSAVGEGSTTAQSTQTDFRLCDCAHEGDHDIIAPRLGFSVGVPGDCASQTLGPLDPCPAGKECVDVDGHRTVRADRYKCTELSEQACHADSAICTWTDAGSGNGTCDFSTGVNGDKSEIHAYFSDCLEHCLLLYQCTAISFYQGPDGPAGLGGCDFYTNQISSETTRETGGNITCLENIPFATPAPPAPDFTSAPIPSIQAALPTASPQSSSSCPIGFSVSSGGGASTSERRASASSQLQTGGTNGTNSTVEGPCRCEIFSNESTPFVDVDHSYCGIIPQWWYGGVHFTCPHCMEMGSVINVTCPNQHEACDLMINLYACPGCSSSGGQAWHGGWPSSLGADGWTAAGRCSPSFCSSEGKHPFVGFHKQILGGDTEVLPEMETDPTMYFSIIVLEGRVCSSITNQTECVDSPVCQWEGTTSTCYMAWCPSIGTGPSVTSSSGCGPCAPGTPSGQCINTNSTNATTSTPPSNAPSASP